MGSPVILFTLSSRLFYKALKMSDGVQAEYDRNVTHHSQFATKQQQQQSDDVNSATDKQKEIQYTRIR